MGSTGAARSGIAAVENGAAALFLVQAAYGNDTFVGVIWINSEQCRSWRDATL
jgi:hypothetical protein